ICVEAQTRLLVGEEMLSELSTQRISRNNCTSDRFDIDLKRGRLDDRTDTTRECDNEQVPPSANGANGLGHTKLKNHRARGPNNLFRLGHTQKGRRPSITETCEAHVDTPKQSSQRDPTMIQLETQLWELKEMAAKFLDSFAEWEAST
ncbi:hypothetical protein HAX54_012694, partial [Datura stramonium]|nr:hypothetical protein [Datura stramonium]